MDERSLHGDVYVVLKAVYLHLLREENQFDCVDTHPRYPWIQILQLLQLILVVVKHTTNDAV